MAQSAVFAPRHRGCLEECRLWAVSRICPVVAIADCPLSARSPRCVIVRAKQRLASNAIHRHFEGAGMAGSVAHFGTPQHQRCAPVSVDLRYFGDRSITDRGADLHGPPRLTVNVMRARAGRPAHRGCRRGVRQCAFWEAVAPPIGPMRWPALIIHSSATVAVATPQWALLVRGTRDGCTRRDSTARSTTTKAAAGSTSTTLTATSWRSSPGPTPTRRRLTRGGRAATSTGPHHAESSYLPHHRLLGLGEDRVSVPCPTDSYLVWQVAREEERRGARRLPRSPPERRLPVRWMARSSCDRADGRRAP